VKKGRAALNFSEWENYTVEKQAKQLEGICEQVSEGEMPGLAYTLLHARARLSRVEVQALCRWSQNAAAQLVGNQETPASAAE